MTDDARLPGSFPRRWGADAPIEMRPKSWSVQIDAVMEDPALLAAAIERGQEEMQRNARQFIDAISAHEDLAFFALRDAGVDIERMQRFIEVNSTDRGFLVDGEKACTISTRFITHEQRYEIEIKTTWHGEWERQIR